MKPKLYIMDKGKLEHIGDRSPTEYRITFAKSGGRRRPKPPAPPVPGAKLCRVATKKRLSSIPPTELPDREKKHRESWSDVTPEEIVRSLINHRKMLAAQVPDSISITEIDDMLGELGLPDANQLSGAMAEVDELKSKLTKALIVRVRNLHAKITSRIE